MSAAESCRRAVLLLAANRLDDAQRELGAAAGTHPEDPEVWRLLAILHRARGEVEASLGALEHAVALGLGPVEALTVRLQTLYFGDRHAGAVGVAYELLAHDPASALAHTMIARMLGEAGREQQRAVMHGRAAVSLAPEDPTAHYALGIASAGQPGRWGAIAGEPALREAVRLDPTHVPALNALGIVDLKRRRAVRALRSFAAVLALDPQQEAPAHNTRLALWSILMTVDVVALGLFVTSVRVGAALLALLPPAVGALVGLLVVVAVGAVATWSTVAAFPPALRRAAVSTLRRDPVLRPPMLAAAYAGGATAVVLAVPIRSLAAPLVVLCALVGAVGYVVCLLLGFRRMRRLRRSVDREKHGHWVGIGARPA